MSVSSDQMLTQLKELISGLGEIDRIHAVMLLMEAEKPALVVVKYYPILTTETVTRRFTLEEIKPQ